jgi:hypothetical protein
MTSTVDADSDIWVHDYTTATGVQVAGHWRKRRPGPAVSDDAGPAPHPDAGTAGESHQPDFPAPSTVSPQRSSAQPPAAPPSAHPHRDPAVAPARLGAAEARYKAALVAAGVLTLKRSRGEACDLQSALKERSEAKAELEAAQAEIAHQPFPPATANPSFSSFSSVSSEGEPENSSTPRADRCPDCGQFRSQDHQCPSPAGLPAGDYSGLKGDDRVKAMVADLESSVKAIIESGQLHRWLNAMSSNGLSRWSANNRLLAAVQMLQRGESLDDLHMMGFRQWEKWNRKVSKGAKAVWILAPITRKVVDEDDDGNNTEKHRVVGFKGVPVFDVSDTHGEPLPSSPARPAPGGSTPGTIEGLRDRVGQAGYSYEETEIPGCRPETGEGTLGYTDPKTKRIVVDARLNDAQKASTIAHELGHVHCGHVDQDYSEYQRHRGRMETEAEACAYLTVRARGASKEQSDAFSPAYIAGWSRGDAKIMHTALDKAVKAHNKIMEGTWPGGTK